MSEREYLIAKAKLPRLRRLTANQPHDMYAPDTIIHNGRNLTGAAERMEAVTQMNRAALTPKWRSPYRVKYIPASGGAAPLQPTGPGARRSDTVLIERRGLHRIPAVQAGAGVLVAGGVTATAYRRRNR